MTAILFKLLRPALPYLIVAAAILGAIIYVAMLRHELAAADQKNVVLAADNQADLAAITAYKAQQAKWNAALSTLDARALASNAAAEHIVDGISAAPAADDAPVAPVLAQALDGLRALQGDAP